eukprot:5703388-Pyramimonas_sp.AAC.1
MATCWAKSPPSRPKSWPLPPSGPPGPPAARSGRCPDRALWARTSKLLRRAWERAGAAARPCQGGPDRSEAPRSAARGPPRP